MQSASIAHLKLMSHQADTEMNTTTDHGKGMMTDFHRYPAAPGPSPAIGASPPGTRRPSRPLHRLASSTSSKVSKDFEGPLKPSQNPKFKSIDQQ